MHEQDLALSLPDGSTGRAPAARRGLHALAGTVAVAAVAGALAAVATLAASDRVGRRPGTVEARLAAAEAELDALRASESAQQQALFRLSVLERRLAELASPATADEATREAVPVLLALQSVRDRLGDGGPFVTAVTALRPFARAGRDPAGAIDALIAHAARGVTTIADLRLAFVRLNPLLEAQAGQREGGLFGRLGRGLHGILSGLGILDPIEPDPLRRAGPEVDAALARGDLATAVAAVERIDAAGQAIVASWLSAARARLAVEQSVEALSAAAWRMILERS